jgi:membrane protein implicated in regulation of membrane protease activity
METFFLGCFTFGALFTAITTLLGMAHTSVPGADVGHFGHIGHVRVPHAGGHGAGFGAHNGHVGAGHAPAHAGTGHASAGQAAGQGPSMLALLLPFLNASSLLAFLTWFGAAGYLALRVGAWPLALALAVAAMIGLIGAVLIVLFMQKVQAGEISFTSADFRLEGTLGRISVGIPEGGVGEVIFTKAGRRRGEAARSTSSGAVARGTEVVILGYKAGVAHVQPWEELLRERPPPLDSAPQLTQEPTGASSTQSHALPAPEGAAEAEKEPIK